MNEYDIYNTIKDNIGDKYIGDDCAYLRDLGIVITQDSLVEDIHFKRKWSSAYQLGYKSTAVNISDILAAGAEPKYITIALRCPIILIITLLMNFIKVQKTLYMVQR